MGRISKRMKFWRLEVINLRMGLEIVREGGCFEGPSVLSELMIELASTDPRSLTQGIIDALDSLSFEIELIKAKRDKESLN